MKRFVSTLGLLCGAAAVFALLPFGKVFSDTYKPKAGGTLDGLKCAVCHVSPKGAALNAYGKDIQSAMKAAGTKKMAAAHLKAVEGKDSDGDGANNLAEIKADKNPGAK